ncbi:hypothetical protein [Rhodococcus sp. BS-15]|uniref:hypothetical protein n=1 Tax=Rhodococcus sp. BS-15 TaxID=1304954 RepID=UPI000FFCA0B5|nr:hypothetical protein [Rhodococcus sp. BS-15]
MFGRGEENGKTPDADGNGYWPLFVVAIALVVVFLVLSVWLFTEADDEGTTEMVWSRYAYIVGGLEAIVFAAVGWLFGREVNRGTAEVAKKQADEAKQDADAAKDAADAGIRLAGEVNGFLGKQPAGGVDALATQSLRTAVDTLFPLKERQ